jgi:hypothetical protein
MRIVAIDASDRAFLQTVPEGAIERGTLADVAGGAKRIGLCRQQRRLCRFMHCVAREAIKSVSMVGAKQTAALCFCAIVAGKAGRVYAVAIRPFETEDLFLVGGFRVLSAGPMAGLATAAAPVELPIGL